MSKTASVIVCVVGAALFLVWMAQFDRGDGLEGELGRVEVSGSSSTPVSRVDELVPTDALTTRTELARIEAVGEPVVLAVAEESPPETAIVPWIARGIVLDTRGTPMPGMEILRAGEKEDVLAETAGDGRFEVDLEDRQAAFIARGVGIQTVFAGAADLHLADEPAVVMVARVVHLSGIVTAKSGEPVGGAVMTMEIPWEGVIGFPRSLERSSRVDLQWRSQKDGAFDLEAVPVIPGIPLSTAADGFRPRSLEVPLSDEFGMVIELQPITDPAEGDASKEIMFSGLVHDPEGRPVEGASLFLGHSRAESDSSGRWEFARGGRIVPGTPLAAIHESRGMGSLPYDESWNGSSGSGAPLVIVLEPNDLAIKGHVVDSDGQPLVGWSVELLDPTSLSLTEIPTITLERKGAAGSIAAVTDSEGHFELDGLLDREYDVRAYVSPSYLSIVQPKVPAGTSDLEIRLAKDATMDELHVRVTTKDGVAVPNVTVQTRFILQRTRSGFMSDHGTTGITDEDGKVVLSQVPRHGVDLVASKPGIVTGYLYSGDAGFLAEEVELQVDRNLEIVVDCSRLDPVPKRVRIFDEDGERLMISSRTARGSTSSTDLKLEEGLSPVVTVSEAARELVILKDGEVVERVPIQLTPGVVTRIEVP